MLFLGITGSGKTTLAEALQALMPGKNIALHPHWQQADEGEPADFAHCDEVIGGGRNFDAISEFIEGLHEEMDDRSKLTKGQLRAKPFINVLVDELPAIAKNCGEVTIERLISLLFEARKFGIRLMVLAQADSVKVLKLEGQGAVRENLCYVRLGGLAIDHAKWLVSKKLADERLIQWLQGQAYPCMIEDYPAIIPAISRGQFIGGIPTPPGTPPDGGKELFTPPHGVKDEVNSQGKSPELSSGKVISFPSNPQVKGVNWGKNPALDAILTAAAEGKLSSGFITNDLACQGKYYAGAKRIIDMITGQPMDA